MPVELYIGNKIIGPSKPAFIIAEIGQNHQGNITIAKQLIETAKECGADCVKFQKTCLTEKFNKAALNRPYLCNNSWGNTYGEHKAFLEFSNEEFMELQKCARENNVMFTASPMDLVSLNFLCDINVPFIKIGSGDANNFILIKEAASKNIPLFVSTGMQSWETVKSIYSTISRYHKKFCLLHCVSSYPTPVEDINLNILNLYKTEFSDINIGYSGHELGTIVTTGAVVLGAKVIERHITLGKTQKGSDHLCSLNPEEFKQLVQSIRLVESALGQPIKEMQGSELCCYQKLGKSLVAAKALKAGTIISSSDVKVKVAEPKGIDAADMHNVIGRILLNDIDEDDSILKNYLQ